MRIAILIGANIDKGMDQQVEFRGNAIIHQPSEEDAAKQVKVLKVGGDDLSVLVIIVTILVLGYNRGAK